MKKKILYHAVSSYQLLEVMLHRMTCHERDYCVLLLPDFITRKYPGYRRLEKMGFFEEVYLFPYLHIPHIEEEQVIRDCEKWYDWCVFHDIRSFSRIYVAGAHFYFSLYLIRHKIPFVFFEDGAGMLERSEELSENLKKSFPLHGEIADKYGLFDGSNALITKIICAGDGGRRTENPGFYEIFSVERVLKKLPRRKRKRVAGFFVKHKIWGKRDGILLTQQFANLGIMTKKEQEKRYQRARQQELKGKSLFVKVHPDDTLDYRRIFPEAKIIRPIFPAELLPYVFYHRPKTVYAFDSTACRNLSRHFEIITMEDGKL